MRTSLAAAIIAGSLFALPLMTASGPALAQQQPATPAVDPALSAVLAGTHRDADRPRDLYRHPAETLTFFGVKPGMTVVDYMPSGGWYTRILVPYLGESGIYVGMNPDVSNSPEFMRNTYANLADKLPKQIAEWSGGKGAQIMAFNVGEMPEELKGSVDRVLMFREFHNQYRFNWLQPDLAAVRQMLKDDGLVGVVEHRARPNAPASYTDGSKGYMRERDVISAFEAAGFDLVAASEINANPKDPANHANGVWMLPPVLGGATDETRAAMQAIGESDRMTLLFRKRP
jgi:predicted methyltransferase